MNLLLAVILQASFSYSLRNYLYFTDDHEPLARAMFFDSVYENQFSVHMPLPTLVSYIWSEIFGINVLSNRMLAALLNIPSLFIVLQIASGSILTLLVGVVLFFMLQSCFWGFANLASLNASFFFSATAILIILQQRKNDYLKAKLYSFTVIGILLGLSFWARFMSIPFIGVIGLYLVIRDYKKENLLKNLNKIFVGFLSANLIMLLIFGYKDWLIKIYTWAFLFNIHHKTHSFSVFEYFGNINSEIIRVVWVLFIVASFYSIKKMREGIFSFDQMWWLFGFVGVILSANPSGLGDVPFHAVGAIPFLIVGIVMILYQLKASRRFAFLLFLALISRQALATMYDAINSKNEVGNYEQINNACRVINEMNMGNSVFVFGTDPYIYVSCRMNSPVQYSILYPGISSLDSEIRDQLSRSCTGVAVIKDAGEWGRGLVLSFPQTYKYLQDNFINVQGIVFKRNKSCVQE